MMSATVVALFLLLTVMGTPVAVAMGLASGIVIVAACNATGPMCR